VTSTVNAGAPFPHRSGPLEHRAYHRRAELARAELRPQSVRIGGAAEPLVPQPMRRGRARIWLPAVRRMHARRAAGQCRDQHCIRHPALRPADSYHSSRLLHHLGFVVVPRQKELQPSSRVQRQPRRPAPSGCRQHSRCRTASVDRRAARHVPLSGRLQGAFGRAGQPWINGSNSGVGRGPPQSSAPKSAVWPPPANVFHTWSLAHRFCNIRKRRRACLRSNS